jgi:tetratricopeptide (TPR) repeat protein
MKTRIDELIHRLDLLIGSGMVPCRFNDPADMAAVDDFENKHGVRLPVTHKAFLAYANGGMIVNDSLVGILREGDFETAAWNANYLLSIREITEAYDSFARRRSGSMPACPYIPFCRSSTGEYLVFVNTGDGDAESPVFDAFHEEPPESWGLVANDFTDFLESYFDKQGYPDMMGDESKGVAADYMALPEAAGREESPDSIIRRTTATLEEEPGNAWAHIEQGIAYQESGMMREALEEFNRGIALEGSNAFYYFRRGHLMLSEGFSRDALIDFDIAVKLEPCDALYLNCRAEALARLQKYPEALHDLEKVLEIDKGDILAYLLRENIYRELGETAKADADARMIEKLTEEE